MVIDPSLKEWRPACGHHHHDLMSHSARTVTYQPSMSGAFTFIHSSQI